jgi:outer membrane protein OmpA-like peptidoglycan-associated protein
MKQLLILLFILVSLTAPPEAYCQKYHTTSNRALKLYKEGLTSYDFIDYNSAEEYFSQAIAADSKFYEAYMMLGELMLKQKRYREAVANYRIAVKLDSAFYLPVFFSLANAEISTGDYANAGRHFSIYLSLEKISSRNLEAAKKNLKNCEFAIEALKNPVPFSPVSVGEGINTVDDEYWPSITADGQMLIFTRQAKPGDQNRGDGIAQEDFYVSYLSDNSWQKAINAGPPLNTRQNEGAQSLSSDGSYMYFTACDRPGGLGSCDIFFSSRSKGRWSVPLNIGSPVNSQYWESQPSVSADGKVLYFSSSRPGGFGGKDIWCSVSDDKGKWSSPKNMGEIINTPGDEMSPFIHFDGKTLYFSSDGLPGMGGSDIYFTRMKEDSTWSVPHNLGYPINTFSDETGLIIESGGQKAYYSSKRDDHNGKNIYWFNLYESIRPDPVAYLKGKVFDKETGKTLVADCELINLSTGKSVLINSSDADGNFLVCLPSGYNYGINVRKKGYLFYSENFMLEDKHTALKPYLKQISLSPLKVGESMLLANVFFEVDAWMLKKESVNELNNLLNLLKENKEIIVEIGGYTDATGTDEHNQILSEKRALAVVDFLRENGIASGRLKYKGYGNASPKGNNITSEGRKLNRRTEVMIVGIGSKTK